MIKKNSAFIESFKNSLVLLVMTESTSEEVGKAVGYSGVSDDCSPWPSSSF